MAERLQRVWLNPGLEIRADSDGKRTLVGRAVPYNEWADIREPLGSFRERFLPGAFAKSIAERPAQRVKLLANHDSRKWPIGRALRLEETSEGLEATFQLARTQDAEEATRLVEDGVLDGLSVSFDPLQSKWSNDRESVSRVEAKLVEISLTAFPAYAGAAVLALRDDHRSLSGAAARRQIEILETDWSP